MKEELTPDEPEQLEEFKRELDAKLAATTDDQLSAELEAVGCDFTTPAPAERPTPVTDAALCISHHPNDLLGWPEGRKAQFGGDHIVPARVCRDLERQLAEARKHHSHTSGNLYDEQQAHGLTKGKLTECQYQLAEAEERIELVGHAGKSALNTLQADMDRLKEKIKVEQHENATLRDRITELEESSISWFIAAQELATFAQDVVDRWDTPKWKDAEPTAHFINRLRSGIAALKAHPSKLTLRKLHAVIMTDGRIIAESEFKDENHAWTVALGWPSTNEIEHAKKQGARCVLASLVFENAGGMAAGADGPTMPSERKA